jgi:hypothetical protein
LYWSPGLDADAAGPLVRHAITSGRLESVAGIPPLAPGSACALAPDATQVAWVDGACVRIAALPTAAR